MQGITKKYLKIFNYFTIILLILREIPKSLVIPNFIIPTISGISKIRYNKKKLGIIKKSQV